MGGSMTAPEPPAAADSEADRVSDLSTLPEAPVGDLRIQVVDEGHAYVQNLECSGDPDSDPGACAEIARVAAEWAEDDDQASADNPFAEVARGSVCTEREYGPQEAVITGTWQGEEVSTELNRADSCEEARWQRLRAVTAPLD
ncbi:hypothetical protein [Streptomonospora mangrovi]|nr:hypothetical protein [Streptomonospora mangrovi]